MDGLVNVAGDILTAARELNGDASMWARFFLARCVDAYTSVRMLVESDHVVDAMAMARVLYEGMMSFSYIFDCPEAAERQIRLLIWRRHGLRQVLKRERHLGDVGLVVAQHDREVSEWAVRTASAGVERIDQDLADLGAVVRSDPTLIDKTKALGLEATYAILFRQSSDALHTSPMLLGEYAVADGRGGTRMADYGPIVLIVASRTMARVCSRAGAMADDSFAELSRQYSKVFEAVDLD
jgi:hypothetical protein